MKYQLFYRDESLGQAWESHFQHCPNVSIVNGDITEANCDAIVSPANSFGFMDGGLDLTISEKFGWDLQDRLQLQIRNLPERELLIGKALVVQTNNDRIPWLISAPTMRVPMSFNIATSINAYLAMKAILIASINHENVQSVAIPGLCTGVGRMPVEIAAKQMYCAFDEIVLGNVRVHEDFGDAQKHQVELNSSTMIWDY